VRNSRAVLVGSKVDTVSCLGDSGQPDDEVPTPGSPRGPVDSQLQVFDVHCGEHVTVDSRGDLASHVCHGLATLFNQDRARPTWR